MDFQEHQKLIERDLLIISASSLSGMNPIGPHRLICTQVKQQSPHKFGISWEFLQSSPPNSGLWGSQGLSSVLKTKAKKALYVSGLLTSLFVR